MAKHETGLKLNLLKKFFYIGFIILSRPASLFATNFNGLVLPSSFWSHSIPGTPSSDAATQKSKKILFIGDSHSVASFGDHFRERVIQDESQRIELLQYAVSGSHLLNWVQGDFSKLRIRNLIFSKNHGVEKTKSAMSFQLSEKMKELKPDQVIIALGTNDILALKNGLIGWKSYEQQMEELKALGVPVVWILPPRLKEGTAKKELQERYKGMIIHHFSEAQTLDSTQFLPDQKDGVHFQRDSARQWAESIWAQYNQRHLNL